MLVHIVLGSVPGRIQNRNRFGFVRLFERCRTPGPRYVATPTAGSDHEERFTEMRFKTRSGEEPSSGDCGARRTRTGVSPRTTLSNRDQQGVPVLLKLLPVDLNDDKAGSD